MSESNDSDMERQAGHLQNVIINRAFEQMFEIFQRDQCEDFCVDLSMTSLAIGRQIQPEGDFYQSGKQHHRNKDLFLPEQEFFLLSV